MNEPPVSEGILVSWPIGPNNIDYSDERNSSIVTSWVTYKFIAARWYITMLERLVDVAGSEHYVGVEMTFDGALASLNGAFDAAIGGLIQESEGYLQKEAKRLVLTPSHAYGPRLFQKQMDKLSGQGLRVDVASVERKITAALKSPSLDDATVGTTVRHHAILTSLRTTLV